MTNRVYAFDLQGLELPASPPALGAGASREDRARHREAVSEHRKQVRTFCDSLAAELADTGRPPLRSYLHAARDGKPLLVMSVFEDRADAEKELEKAGAEFLYTEDPEPSVEGQVLKIPATFQHQTIGQGLTPDQIGRDGISRNKLAGAIRRQVPGVPGEAGQQVRWMTATKDETNGTLLITRARNPSPQPTQQNGGRELPALTLGELIALLQQLPPEMPVEAEGCDCVNEVKGVGVYRLAPDDGGGPHCILNQYQGGMRISGVMTTTERTPRHLISPLGPNCGWVPTMRSSDMYISPWL